MPYDPQKHHRHSIRLPGYDYSQPGAYFVTIVTYQREPLLGEIPDARVHLSRAGAIVLDTWKRLPQHYPTVELDEFCVMPNHVHGIIILREGSTPVPPRHGLPEIVRAFKSFSAQRVNRLRHSIGIPVWQRNYYEHIVRTEADLAKIRQYIRDNPLNWGSDEENPSYLSGIAHS